ncbi:hypothetical protein JXA88_16300 [Candidatus Fermentibacteria bacterium]|nr:hypothetical protein [Candidatus Fermentibacteria bacterium]
MLVLVVQEHPEIRLSGAAARVGRYASSLAAGAARLWARIGSDGSLCHRLSEMKGVLILAHAVPDGLLPE